MQQPQGTDTEHVSLMSHEELRAWALIARAQAGGYQRISSALKVTGSAAALVSCSPVTLQRLGFSETARQALTSPDWERIEADLQWLNTPHCHLLPLTSPYYPVQLATASGAPSVLYVRGSLATLATPQVAIVGSRHPSTGGRETAQTFAAALARLGITITSGLAEGIDAASHRGALSIKDGLTLGVCAAGLDRIYPSSNTALASEIVKQGALVSEYPPGFAPRKGQFPQRNRIISGLSLGVLVVEAAQKSGSLITARFAADQGREVFAVPGSIHNPLARGCHALIRDGARLTESVTDIIGELKIPFKNKDIGFQSSLFDTPSSSRDAIDKEYEILLDALGFDPLPIDTIVERSGLKPAAAASMLLILELKGDLEVRPGGRYCRIRS